MADDGGTVVFKSDHVWESRKEFSVPSFLGKLVEALKYLADQPELLALVMIVLAIVAVILGVVARPSAERNDLVIALSALFIILVIGGVISTAFLGGANRKSAAEGMNGIGSRKVAYVNRESSGDSSTIDPERP